MTDFDRFRERYVERVDEAVAFAGVEQEFFLRAKARVIERLASADGGGLRMLDVGCGIGLLHRMLPPTTTLFGVDIAPRSLGEARARAPHDRFACYDGERLPFADDSFDFVSAVCVMHHVPPEDWPAFSAELARVVRPGGLVAVFEHNPWNPLTRWVVNQCELDDDAVLLGPSTLRAHFRGAGLVEREARYILFFPWSGAFWRALEEWLGWLPLGAQYYLAGAKGGAAS